MTLSTNIDDLYRACQSFLSDGHDTTAWEELEASAENSERVALQVILKLIAGTDDCEGLGAIAAGPLWILLQNAEDGIVEELAEAVTCDDRVARCVAAIDRYRTKILLLQQRLALLSGCETVPEHLRVLRGEKVVSSATARYGREGCVRVVNPYARRDANGSMFVPDEETSSRRSSLLVQVQSEPLEILRARATDLDDLLLRREHTLLPRVVAQLIRSPRFRCRLSYTVLVTLSESTVDVLLAVMHAIESDR